MTNVLIVEDSRISREAIERKLTGTGEYAIAAAIENAANAEIVCLGETVDLVLMDICTADDESGLEAAARIKKKFPRIRVIVMTSMPEESFLRKARDSGCDSFWYKETGEMTLTEACERTLRGEFVWPEETPSVMIGAVRSDQLTIREWDVLRGLAEGWRYEDIAARLDVSVNTVKYHVKNLLQKTGFRNTTQLVAEAVSRRLILPGY